MNNDNNYNYIDKKPVEVFKTSLINILLSLSLIIGIIILIGDY